MASQLFYGKYRGVVVANADPMMLGRIQATVPDVTGQGSASWAMPCFAVAGADVGVFVVPQIGTHVWIEFERGDPDFPIWTGCYFRSGDDVPALALASDPASPRVVVQTSSRHTVAIEDAPGATGGMMLTTTSGATIVVSDEGITIDNGKGSSVVFTGPTDSGKEGGPAVT